MIDILDKTNVNDIHVTINAGNVEVDGTAFNLIYSFDISC